MVEIIFLIPFFTGAIAFFLPHTAGRLLLVLTGLVHLAMTVSLWMLRPEPMFPDYFAITPEGCVDADTTE